VHRDAVRPARGTGAARGARVDLLGHPLRFALRHPRRVLNNRRTAHDSALAHRWLDGLKGVEIGGAAHNDFHLDTLNVDRYPGTDTVFKREELRVCGRAMAVDVVASGDELPFADDAFDFVLASHVIEHFCDPIRALEEWRRVARRYVFLVVPHRDRTFDRDRPLTPLSELIERHENGLRSVEDRHWSVWTLETFEELCNHLKLTVLDRLDPDDKTGNGFMVALAA
jgi:SAM-dependent methyltransferase